MMKRRFEKNRNPSTGLVDRNGLRSMLAAVPDQQENGKNASGDEAGAVDSDARKAATAHENHKLNMTIKWLRHLADARGACHPQDPAGLSLDEFVEASKAESNAKRIVRQWRSTMSRRRLNKLVAGFLQPFVLPRLLMKWAPVTDICMYLWTLSHAMHTRTQ